jgi:hypothetical protein
MQAALIDPPQDLHDVQEHDVMGQAEQAPVSTGGGGNLMIGEDMIFNDGLSVDEGMTFGDGMSDDEDMTFGEPSTATTTTAQKGKEPRKPPAPKHNKGRTGRAAAPKPQPATRGKRKAETASDDESEVEEVTATKPKRKRKNTQLWNYTVVGLLSADARLILAEEGIHPTKKAIRATITKMLRDAVLDMYAEAFPGEGPPTHHKTDTPEGQDKIITMMDNWAARYNCTFYEDQLRDLLARRTSDAQQLLTTSDLLHLHVTLNTGTFMHRHSDFPRLLKDVSIYA